MFDQSHGTKVTVRAWRQGYPGSLIPEAAIDPGNQAMLEHGISMDREPKGMRLP